MKTKIFLLVMTVMLSIGSISAEEKKELTKEQKKELQAKRDSIDFIHSSRAIDDRHFALQADQVIYGRGGSDSVLPSTNFIVVNGDQGIIQVSPKVGGGPNGLGGITIDGTISGYKVRTDKKGNKTISMTVSSMGTSSSVSITLYSGSNNASARVSATFHSDNVTLNGNLVPYNHSDVTIGSHR